MWPKGTILGDILPKTKIWVVDRSFGILTRNTFHLVLYWAKKRTHTHTQIMSYRILSVQFCSSSVDVRVLWQETEIEKKRKREKKI